MTTPRPHVTIFSDASFDFDSKAAGWAAWMKGNGKPAHMAGGKIKAACEFSRDAETFAAVNALYIARDRGYFTAGQVVMLQSDCTQALSIFLHHIPGTIESKHPDGVPVQAVRRLKATHKQAIAAIIKLIAETPIQIIVRHVRGHQPGRGRAWVNEECDKLAKLHMRAARAKAAA